ncbi:MAG: HTTM domain-containing protein [Verrucomicrobiales bacterium]|nr:HTTM domain-containing protein [Verrucomicrobiales bacterium]
MSESISNNSPDSKESPDIFPGFAKIWACATLIHQLAFTFWAESWPGWVLVLAAISVLFQPTCFYRFTWLVVASLLNLFNKLPFVPNHILFEGMLHVTMLLSIGGLIVKNGAGICFKGAIQDGWKLRFLIGIVLLKLLYHIIPAIPKNHLLGGISTALLLLSIGMHLFSNKPVKTGNVFISTFAPVGRIAVLTMYLCAAIQKLNYDYLNPAISCASKLHIEIADYFGELVPTKTWALHGAIWGSLFFEIAIPILLLVKKTRTIGVIFAVWFHIWLSIHPAAGIFSFSSLILAVLYLFLPVGFWKELQNLYSRQLRTIGGGDIEKGRTRTQWFVILFFLIILSTQIYMYTTTARSYAVFHRANRVGFIAYFTWAMWLGTCYVIASVKGRGKDNYFPNQPVKSIAWLGLLLIVLNGASPWLGGKTQTSFSMYSNLKSEGSGNHLFLKRIDLLPFQKDLVTITAMAPNILDPSTRPRGIANFANIGHRVLPWFELRRLLSTIEGDFTVSYEYQGELHTVSRRGETITGDEKLLEPLPLLARKFLWFRRLNAIEGPMPCTH